MSKVGVRVNEHRDTWKYTTGSLKRDYILFLRGKCNLTHHYSVQAWLDNLILSTTKFCPTFPSICDLHELTLSTDIH